MATVPNYYYNSPWIAEAGRNLASALAPPDPLRTLEAQKQKMTMEILQRQQQIMEEDRTRGQTAVRSFSNIFNAPPAVTAGSPGEMAFLKTQYPGGVPTGPNPEDIENVLAAPETIPLGNLLSILSTDDPRSPFNQKRMLASQSQESKLANLLLTLDARRDIAADTEGGRNKRFDAQEARIEALTKMIEDNKLLIAKLNNQNDLDVANTRIGASGQPRPITIPVTALDDLRRVHSRFLSERGITNPDPRLLDGLSQYSLRLYKEGYNDAPQRAQAYFFGDNPEVTEAYEPLGPDWIGGREPHPASIGLKDGMSLDSLLQAMPDFAARQLGGAAVGDGAAVVPGAAGAVTAPTAGATVPPPSTGAPTQNVMSPEQLQLLQGKKEGEVVLLGDGTGLVMIGGKPVLLSPDRLKQLIEQSGGR